MKWAGRQATVRSAVASATTLPLHHKRGNDNSEDQFMDTFSEVSLNTAWRLFWDLYGDIDQLVSRSIREVG